MKVLGNILFAVFGLTILALIYYSYSNWFALWGALGVVLTTFLMPLAIFFSPLAAWVRTHDSKQFLGYLIMAGCVGLFFLGQYLCNRGEYEELIKK